MSTREMHDSLFNYAATVDRVVDGDTVDLTVDYGFRTYASNRFRLYGIDTPERGQPRWADATAHLAALMPVGSQVVIRSYKPTLHPKSDSFGRWLVDIYAGEIHVNKAMLDSGLAVVYTR